MNSATGISSAGMSQSPRIMISLAGEGQERGGFQAAARFADGPATGLQAGRLDSTGPGTTVRTDTLSAVQYAYHTEQGTEQGTEDRSTWDVQWTAPQSRDPVVFHVAANSANGDNSPFGDLIRILEKRLEASGASGLSVSDPTHDSRP